jgi:hypothetical protein
MKTPEDEAFDDLAKKQGDWGSGFQTKPWNEDEWRRNEWRCRHGWLRGEQCEICNAPKREWVGLTEEDRKAALLTAYKEWECEELLLCAREDYLLIEQALKEKNNG